MSNMELWYFLAPVEEGQEMAFDHLEEVSTPPFKFQHPVRAVHSILTLCFGRPSFLSSLRGRRPVCCVAALPWSQRSLHPVQCLRSRTARDEVWCTATLTSALLKW